MAFATVQSWSETPASNTEIDGVNIDEGCNPSGINNAIRELMAQVAAWTGDDTIASATTTDLSTVNGQFVSVTGTTTITGFGTVKAGWVKFLHFAGALTLTHNATSMILPGGNNITTVAGDTAAFVSLGSGNWRCLVPPGYISLSSANTWTAVQTVRSSSASPLLVDRTGSAVSASVGFSTTAGTIYLGNGDGASFGVGSSQNINSAAWMNVSASALTSTVPVLVPDGTVSAPGVAPASDTNTGIYALAADSLGFTMGGTHIGHLNSTGWTVSNTSGATTFGSVDAVKNLISGGGQVDVTNTTGGSAMRLSRASGTNGTVESFHFNTTSVGTISVTGSATSYNTSSDERLKEFIGQFDPLKAIEIIRADPVRDYNWIAERGGGYGVGWGAQTSYAVSPDLATPGAEESDEWGVDKGARTPYLWAALTWALDKIEELEDRLDAANL